MPIMPLSRTADQRSRDADVLAEIAERIRSGALVTYDLAATRDRHPDLPEPGPWTMHVTVAMPPGWEPPTGDQPTPRD